MECKFLIKIKTLRLMWTKKKLLGYVCLKEWNKINWCLILLMIINWRQTINNHVVCNVLFNFLFRLKKVINNQKCSTNYTECKANGAGAIAIVIVTGADFLASTKAGTLIATTFVWWVIPSTTTNYALIWWHCNNLLFFNSYAYRVKSGSCF